MLNATYKYERLVEDKHMSNDYTQQKFKTAAFQLQQQALKHHDVKLNRGQAHELIASAVDDYNSMAALKSDGFSLDVDCPEQFSLEGAERRIGSRINSLRLDEKLPDSFSHNAAGLIRETLTPNCTECGCDLPTIPINQENDRQYQPQTWVCNDCKSNSNAYGRCFYCGDEYLYRVSDLNENGECPEHAGESEPVDEFEAEDHESWLEYQLNHEFDY